MALARRAIWNFHKDFPPLDSRPRSCPTCEEVLQKRGYVPSGHPYLHFEFGFRVETAGGGRMPEAHLSGLIRAVQEATIANPE